MSPHPRLVGELQEHAFEVVANDTPAAIADLYGHADLEGVFLELAETHGR